MVSAVSLRFAIQIFAVLIRGLCSAQESSTATSHGLCSTATPVTTTSRTKASEIRQVLLSGQTTRYSGQLELRVDESRIVTLCPSGFSMREADVVCRGLHGGSAHAIVPGSLFNASGGPSWNQRLECSGNATQLSQCHIVPQECHGEGRVGILCQDGYYQLRLQGGAERCEGIVQIYQNGSWHEVVHPRIPPEDAEWVCQRLHCGHAVSVAQHLVARDSTVHVSNWTCLATEQRVSNCLAKERNGNFQNIFLRCSVGEVPPFRLVDGRSPCQGRAEVFHRGVWKPLCPINSTSDPGPPPQDPICSQLGCSSPMTRLRGPGMRGNRRNAQTACVECRSLGVRMLTDKSNLWDCKEGQTKFKDVNITCPAPRNWEEAKITTRLSGGVTACIILAVLLFLLLLLSYGWKVYKRDGKEVFRRKQTQRQWIGPTGATSHAVSFHRNNNANLRPVSTQSADGHLYTGTPEKESLSAYPALERRANLAVNPRENSSESDYDFFDTNAQRL
ncbi:T-cell surface glycoprotein CD5-like [Scyliorhinus torazame]|uniref:T-cell surface glycoprotein CD5-like n=1 Tax=Scyliorhinus torazame TaxID=75743 RepID=UPI003B5AC2F3